MVDAVMLYFMLPYVILDGCIFIDKWILKIHFPFFLIFYFILLFEFASIFCIFEVELPFGFNKYFQAFSLFGV